MADCITWGGALTGNCALGFGRAFGTRGPTSANCAPPTALVADCIGGPASNQAGAGAAPPPPCDGGTTTGFGNAFFTLAVSSSAISFFTSSLTLAICSRVTGD